MSGFIYSFLLVLKVEFFGLRWEGFGGAYSLDEQTTVDISEDPFRKEDTTLPVSEWWILRNGNLPFDLLSNPYSSYFPLPRCWASREAASVTSIEVKVTDSEEQPRI